MIKADFAINTPAGDLQSHSILTVDGVRVSLDCYRGDDRRTAVVICPGFFQSKDTPTFRRMAEALAQERDVLAMDFRGHGRSDGFYTFSATEGMDLAAVLGWAQERYARLVVLGFSLGGAIAVNTVSRSPDKVVGLIAVSAPAMFEDIEFKWWAPAAWRTGLDGLAPGVGCRPGSLFLAKERPVERIPQLSPIPLLFLHGTNDPIVGAGHSQRLFAAARDPKQLELIEGGGHAEALFRDEPQRFLELVNGWLSQTLSSSP